MRSPASCAPASTTTPSVRSLFLPRTDAGVIMQLVLTLLIGAPIVWRLWREGLTELVWFAGGVVVLLLGLFAVRTVH